MRRGRAFPGWWAVIVAGVIAGVTVVGFALGQVPLLQTLAVLALAAFVLAICALAESSMAMQAVRLRALEKLSRQHARELAVYADHAGRIITDIRRVSPAAATEASAALSLDLTRLHALGAHIHRKETPRG